MRLSADAPAGTAVPTTTPVFSSSDLYYNEKGTDFVFQNSATIAYNPSSTLNSHMLVFEVNKLASPMVYTLNDLYISAMVKLEDSQQNKPRDNAMVAPVNLFSAALIRSLRLYLNEESLLAFILYNSTTNMGSLFIIHYFLL